MVGQLPVTREEFNELKNEIELIKTMLGAIKLALESQEVTDNELKATVQKVEEAATNAQNTANVAQSNATTATTKAESAQGTANHAVNLVNGIQNGSIIAGKAIVAQKALMLRARDNNHWLRHQGVNKQNNDCFGLWSTDNLWYNLIQVGKLGPLPRGEVYQGPREGPADLSSI